MCLWITVLKTWLTSLSHCQTLQWFFFATYKNSNRWQARKLSGFIPRYIESSFFWSFSDLMISRNQRLWNQAYTENFFLWSMKVISFFLQFTTSFFIGEREKYEIPNVEHRASSEFGILSSLLTMSLILTLCFKNINVWWILCNTEGNRNLVGLSLY